MLGKSLANYAERIATQLPFVGIAAGALVGSAVSSIAESKLNGVSVDTKGNVTINSGVEVKLNIGGEKTNSSVAADAIRHWERGLNLLSDSEISNVLKQAKIDHNEPAENHVILNRAEA